MTNVLSFRLVKSEYEITYDGHSFIIHRAVKGFPDMVFKPHNSGLYVYDPDDPRGMASWKITRHSFRSDSLRMPSNCGISRRVWRFLLILI